jgi:hypothetical protein
MPVLKSQFVILEKKSKKNLAVRSNVSMMKSQSNNT